MQKSSRLKSILIGGLFSLFVPVGAYYFLKLNGHDGHVKLPSYYGIEKINSHEAKGKIIKDTIYHTVNELPLVNQLGDSVFLNKNLPGKILVIGFFSMLCNNDCATLTKNMKLLNKAFIKNDSSIKFLSISIDTTKDAVYGLRQFADEQKANHDKWFFLAGNNTDIQNYAVNELQLKWDKTKSPIPQQFVVLDKYRNIRGYYNGLDSFDMKFCADSIAYLMLEKNKLHEKKRR